MLILGVIWNPKSIKVGVEFGNDFGMFLLSGFKMVLACFGRLCGAQTGSKRQREDLWKCFFYVSNIAVFVACGVHLGCQSERKTEWDSDLDSNLVL